MDTYALTNSQAVFVAAYLEHGDPLRAYRTAYTPDPFAPPAKVAGAARQMLHRKAVQQALKEAKRLAAERASVSVESVCLELEEARQLARTTNDAGTMIKASMGKAKVTGMEAPQRLDVTNRLADPEDSRPDLDALLKRAQGLPADVASVTH